VLCAVVAASRHLVVPIIHSIVIEIGDAIRHALHAAKRIAIHLKRPVHETKERTRAKKMRKGEGKKSEAYIKV